MSVIQLSNGTKVRVGVHHSPLMNVEGEQRFTEAFMTEEAKTSNLGYRVFYSVTALCHPRDTFCRRVGRKVAAQKLINTMREELYKPFGSGDGTKYCDYKKWLDGKKDRREVFLALCPEYKKKESTNATV